MTADRSTDEKAAQLAASRARAVREQLRLGRLLPLGEAPDGAWIAERAAAQVLRPAGAAVAGVRIDSLRLALADPDTAGEPAVPAPPSALPPGPLRIDAELAVTADEPLPSTAERVRAALSRAAVERLGLVVAEVDLRVTELLDAAPPPVAEEAAPAAPSSGEDAAAAVVRAVPGVTAVRVWHEERRARSGEALPGRHLRMELAVGAGFRTLDVARAARAAASTAGRADRPTVAVVVTAVTGPSSGG